MGDFKPADIYVGVMELFTVLLPGAFLTAGMLFAMPDPYLDLVAKRLPTNATQWVAFGFCAYALGAFMFPAAAMLDEGYDAYRKRKTAKGDHAYERATRMRCAFLKTPRAHAGKDDPMNTFRWAKSMLMQHAPAAFGDVQRYEAESKFFRSLTIALPIVGLLAASRLIFDPPIKVASPLLNALLVVVATLLLMRLSHWRYAEQRFKSTQWAYAHVIVLRLGVPVATARTGGE